MLDSIRFLRGLAALLVVVYHAVEYARAHGHPDAVDLFNIGAFGVDIFFVISGYVMLLALDRPVNHNGSGMSQGIDFFARRIIRIAPTYWLGTSMLFFLYMAMPWKFRAFSASPDEYMRSMLFLPLDHGRSTVSPILSQGWTLYHEFYFYSVLSALLILNARKAAGWLAPAAVLSICLALNALLEDTHKPWIELIAAPINVEFAMGCILYQLTHSAHARRWRPWLLALSAASMWLLLVGPDSSRTRDWARVIHWGLPAAGIFYGAIAMEPLFKRLGKQFCEFAGDPSYSIYIFHGLAFSAIDIVLRMTLPSLGLVPFVIALTLASTAMCNLLYRVFERPVSERLSAAWKRHYPQVALR